MVSQSVGVGGTPDSTHPNSAREARCTRRERVAFNLAHGYCIQHIVQDFEGFDNKKQDEKLDKAMESKSLQNTGIALASLLALG